MTTVCPRSSGPETDGIESVADPTPGLSSLLATEPDLVDRIFAYLAEISPDIFGAGVDVAGAKRAVREEFGGATTWVRSPRPERTAEIAAAVLAHFNGRNATEVARRLGISRATVYRCIKQSGR